MSVGKRKREEQPEIEVDVNAPEPPSKKALRRAKKGKPPEPRKNDSDSEEPAESKPSASKSDGQQARQNAPGVWIGNLPWTVTKDELLQFLTTKSEGSVSVSSITRIKMPGPTAAALGAPNAKHKKPVNRGFAYVDFDSTTTRDSAISLSENLIAGRAVLIKDSKSFEGRPDPVAKEQQTTGKPPSQKIFVGNLGFETTEDELREHFSKCGQVKSAFMAKFHDTGKCKGYAWVTFDELVSAEKAMRGWVEIEPEDADEDVEDIDVVGGNDEDGKVDDKEAAQDAPSMAKSRKKKHKTLKPRKWYVNRIKGRDLRMEYAEDPTTRYNKRFGKGRQDRTLGGTDDSVRLEGNRASAPSSKRSSHNPESGMGSDESMPDKAKEKQRESATKPAHSKDKAYLTGAVMEGRGKKTTFD